MRINSNYTIQNTKYYGQTGVKAQRFGSYHAIYPRTGQPATTSFYHDFPTLKNAVGALEKFFPKGAAILVYAGSSGEEAISIYSMLKEPQKYDIYSIDPFKDAVEYAKKGIFKVKLTEEGDGFLISGVEPENEEQREARKCFNKCFTRVHKPIYDLISIMPPDIRDAHWRLSAEINNEDFLHSHEFQTLIRTLPPMIIPVLQQLNGEEYYRLNPEVQKQIRFVEGDIRDIADFKTDKPVGGVFFRNALYHVTNNYTNDNGLFECPDIKTDKQKVLKELISSIEKKLDLNGIFVMGHHMQEHLYYADIYASNIDILHRHEVDFYRRPINIDALRRNGHFTDIYTRNILDAVDQPGIKEKFDGLLPFSPDIPLIWQKVL